MLNNKQISAHIMDTLLTQGMQVTSCMTLSFDGSENVPHEV